MVTAFVVGFVIEEQERRQSAATDPTRYSATAVVGVLGAGIFAFVLVRISRLSRAGRRRKWCPARWSRSCHRPPPRARGTEASSSGGESATATSNGGGKTRRREGSRPEPWRTVRCRVAVRPGVGVWSGQRRDGYLELQHLLQIAEWYALDMSKRARDGFETHTDQGYNVGKACYGYHTGQLEMPGNRGW
ncbi:hypothetical protein AB0H42_32495 [Nocardia sp. NPDC050799]|uniref:hypothetical protein n=1 Tax=Nocardia sp. NPDC050799 TaxID=3154842 RepID=UPI0033D5E1EA